MFARFTRQVATGMAVFASFVAFVAGVFMAISVCAWTFGWILGMIVNGAFYAAGVR